MDSGGLGALDPFTFGEAAISFAALFPPGGACGNFGSAYLKSRSSDSFNAELKDFIAPTQVNITNCTTLTTNATASVTIGDPISDTATLSGATATPAARSRSACSATTSCANEVTTGLTPVTVTGNGNYNSGNFTPTAVGTYYWIASYSGDANNAPSSTACRDANESSVVNKEQPAIVTSATASVIDRRSDQRHGDAERRDERRRRHDHVPPVQRRPVRQRGHHRPDSGHGDRQRELRLGELHPDGGRNLLLDRQLQRRRQERSGVHRMR